MEVEVVRNPLLENPVPVLADLAVTVEVKVVAVVALVAVEAAVVEEVEEAVIKSYQT
ncbi:MAG: hypothetical protein KBA66_09750 [Leptospiraceae bacterium]|nr:hypothetical protein [Leptospiraceae bacterium]